MIHVSITTTAFVGEEKFSLKQVFKFSKDSECEKFLKDFQEKRLQGACQAAKEEYKKTLLTGLYPNDNSSWWHLKTSNSPLVRNTLWVNNERKYSDLRDKVAKHIPNSVKIEIEVV